MVKIIEQQNTSIALSIGNELYQCEECGFKYVEKEWAEKCEAWCKEHKSCNLEITAYSAATADSSDEDSFQNGNGKSSAGGSVGKDDSASKKDAAFLTRMFYVSIGIAASLGLFLVLYWSLRLNSSITSIIANTYNEPFYFWPYVVLTFGTIILFGINISLFIYRWRKLGFTRRSLSYGGPATGFGSLVGIVASACPVCGSLFLSAIGIAGGLAVFPLQGLELKALSFALMGLSFWAMTKNLKEPLCASEACALPRDPAFKENDTFLFRGVLALIAIFFFTGWNMLITDPVFAKLIAVKSNAIANSNDNQLSGTNIFSNDNQLFDEVAAKVLPEEGFQSRIALSDAIVKLVDNGVIDREKIEALYRDRGGLPEEFKNILANSSQNPIPLTRENATVYVNFLWPLGLANYMSSNKESPILGKSLFNFASTGGWNLGKEENGGAYFNKFKIVELTSEQEALVTKIAKNSYRPCCNNSTFFQDCNHGSALLGLLQLGAAQGLTEDELWREALAFNSFWFPDNYIQTALYFKAVKNTDWEKVDPGVVMGKDFSTGSGWSATVAQKVDELGLVPQKKGGAGCGA